MRHCRKPVKANKLILLLTLFWQIKFLMRMKIAWNKAAATFLLLDCFMYFLWGAKKNLKTRGKQFITKRNCVHFKKFFSLRFEEEIYFNSLSITRKVVARYDMRNRGEDELKSFLWWKYLHRCRLLLTLSLDTGNWALDNKRLSKLLMFLKFL